MSSPICTISDIDGSTIYPNNGIIPFGQLMPPLDYFLFTQVIILMGGTTFISSYIDMDNLHPDLSATPDSIFGDVDDIISVTNKAGEVWYRDINFISTLATIANATAYKVLRTERAREVSLNIIGDKLKDSDVYGYTLTIPSGSSWLPTTVNRSVDLERELNMQQEQAIISISDYRGSVYKPGEPRNTLSRLEPGQGYYISTQSSIDWTLLEVDRGAASANSPNIMGDISSEDSHMRILISSAVLQKAIDQLPVHADIVSLHISTIDVFKVDPVIANSVTTKGYAFTHSVLMGTDDLNVSSPLYAYQPYIDFYEASLTGKLAEAVKYRISFRTKYNEEAGGSYTFPHIANLWNKINKFSVKSTTGSLYLTIETGGATFKYLVSSNRPIIESTTDDYTIPNHKGQTFQILHVKKGWI